MGDITDLLPMGSKGNERGRVYPAHSITRSFMTELVVCLSSSQHIRKRNGQWETRKNRHEKEEIKLEERKGPSNNWLDLSLKSETSMGLETEGMM